MLLMRGLAKLSQAVIETQGTTLRNGAGEFYVYFLNTVSLVDIYPQVIVTIWK